MPYPTDEFSANRCDRYVLGGEDGHTPVPCEDLGTWAEWLSRADRLIARTRLGGTTVSTVFLGLDHQFGDGGPPLLYETMIFGGPLDGYCRRCSTWDQAEAQHTEALREATTHGMMLDDTKGTATTDAEEV